LDTIRVIMRNMDNDAITKIELNDNYIKGQESYDLGENQTNKSFKFEDCKNEYQLYVYVYLTKDLTRATVGDSNKVTKIGSLNYKNNHSECLAYSLTIEISPLGAVR